MEKLDLYVTPEARRKIDEFIASSDLPNCKIGLLQRTDGKWYIGGYGKDQAAKLDSTYAENGFTLVYDVGGLEMLIPQTQLISVLEGKTLHRNGAQYVVVNREGNEI